MTQISRFIDYTTTPRQIIEQDVYTHITRLEEFNENYDYILIILGGSCHDRDPHFDKISKDCRTILPFMHGEDNKILVLNIDGEKDHFNPPNTDNVTYSHFDIFFSFDTNCPFNKKLYELIDRTTLSGGKVVIFNSIFRYQAYAFADTEVMSVFKKYKDNINVIKINYITFPYFVNGKRYKSAYILMTLLKNYKKEFKYWANCYLNKYGNDYKQDITKIESIQKISFDEFLIYVFANL